VGHHFSWPLYHQSFLRGRTMIYINLPEHYELKADAHRRAEQHEKEQSPFFVLSGLVLLGILITIILLIWWKL
jgi:hypothetical protein